MRSSWTCCARQKATGGNGLVFPLPVSGGVVDTFSDIKGALTDITQPDDDEKGMALTGWTRHDFRRSFASALGEASFPEAVADAVLNYRQSATGGGVLGVYQRASRWLEQEGEAAPDLGSNAVTLAQQQDGPSPMHPAHRRCGQSRSPLRPSRRVPPAVLRPRRHATRDALSRPWARAGAAMHPAPAVGIGASQHGEPYVGPGAAEIAMDRAGRPCRPGRKGQARGYKPQAGFRLPPARLARVVGPEGSTDEKVGRWNGRRHEGRVRVRRPA
jgi:hypothetical protein